MVVGDTGGILHVDVEVGDVHHPALIPIGTTVHPIPIDIGILIPRQELYEVRCTAKLGNQVYTSTAELRYLPDYSGSAVKLDRRTGGTWVKKDAGWKSIIPFGWYDVSFAF